MLGLDLRVTEDEIVNDAGFVGAGYGIPSEASVEATRLFARTEGVILDPIYTGKAAAGMIAHIREGRYGKDDVLVFVHTGGTPADLHLEHALAVKGPLIDASSRFSDGARRCAAGDRSCARTRGRRRPGA